MIVATRSVSRPPLPSINYHNNKTTHARLARDENAFNGIYIHWNKFVLYHIVYFLLL